MRKMLNANKYYYTEHAYICMIFCCMLQDLVPGGIKRDEQHIPNKEKKNNF